MCPKSAPPPNQCEPRGRLKTESQRKLIPLIVGSPVEPVSKVIVSRPEKSPGDELAVASDIASANKHAEMRGFLKFIALFLKSFQKNFRLAKVQSDCNNGSDHYTSQVGWAARCPSVKAHAKLHLAYFGFLIRKIHSVEHY